MTATTNHTSHNDLKQWDEVMIKVMGDQWHSLTPWQKMCEVAALQEYRREHPSYLSFLIENHY